MREVYVTRSRVGSHSGDDIPCWCLSGVLCCFIFPPIGLALLCVACCRQHEENIKARDQVQTTTYVYS